MKMSLALYIFPLAVSQWLVDCFPVDYGKDEIYLKRYRT